MGGKGVLEEFIKCTISVMILGIALSLRYWSIKDTPNIFVGYKGLH